RNIGAVNTVLNLDGKLIGYNTDGLGYVKSLEKAYPSVKETDPNILLLGAGGAARGIYNGLKSSGYLNIDITNRTVEKAEKIKKTNILQLRAGDNARRIYNKSKSSKYLNIDIAKRTFEKAEKIKQTNLVGRTKILTLEEAESKLDQYDIIIQTTSVGMKPKTNEQIINLDKLKQTAIISDIVYQPIMTQ